MVAAAAILAALAVGAAPARAATPVARATRVGPAPGSAQLTLDLPLATDAAGLARFATAVSDPGSPQYGAYEPVSMLSRRFGAAPVVRRHVLSYLRAIGAHDVSIDVTGQWADATLPAAVAERAFGVGLSAFQTDSGRFVAPNSAVHVPAALRGDVTGVVGLDTEPVDRQGVSGAPSADARLGSGYIGRTGTPSGCPAAVAQPDGFTPNQYQTAYGIAGAQAATAGGRGERVALVEVDGFKRSDIRAFASCFGIPLGKIKRFKVGVRHAPRPGFETTLDLELLLAASPGAFHRRIGVYETRATGASVLRALTAPLRHPRNRPDVISVSLGVCEPALVGGGSGRGAARVVNRALEVAAAAGVSVLASSGDSGSSACVSPIGGADVPLKRKAVNVPASSPWVTAVGGSNFRLDAGNAIVPGSQVVWNDSPAAPTAGGGGVSRIFKRPGYQRGFTKARHRVVPDVSMLADPYPGYLIYCSVKPGCLNKQNSNPWTPFGGTSAGSPLLAGSFALVDAYLRAHGRPNLGFANPLLYRIARSSLGRSVFMDITSGDNDVFAAAGLGRLGCCKAKRGFDPASGLGAVNVDALLPAAVDETRAYAHLKVSVRGKRRLLRSGRERVSVHCSRACLFVAYTRIGIRGQRGTIHVRSRIQVLHRRGRRTVVLHLSRRTRRRIRMALRHHHRVTASTRAAIVDPTGRLEHRTRVTRFRVRR